jgi:hypothetical protein
LEDRKEMDVNPPSLAADRIETGNVKIFGCLSPFDKTFRSSVRVLKADLISFHRAEGQVPREMVNPVAHACSPPGVLLHALLR